jgi:hypothetical protein
MINEALSSGLHCHRRGCLPGSDKFLSGPNRGAAAHSSVHSFSQRSPQQIIFLRCVCMGVWRRLAGIFGPFLGHFRLWARAVAPVGLKGLMATAPLRD